ncbi:MAG TPA: toxin TcdB middle/N-terminal domain-containing protein, partial [Polyangiaceae bacterium]|nr:toxin TcdB middle/N-terminal domain-containing protein [Polyangiaceae bacterium]
YAPAALGAAKSREELSPWTTRLNVGMPVVSEVRAQSALGDPDIVTRFDYRNGAWDAVERTFAGFGRGIQTDVGDESTPTLVTDSTFDQGLATRVLRGQPLTVELRDAVRKIFTKTTNGYVSSDLETTADGAQVKYAYKASERVEHLEGQETGKTTLTEWTQDRFGNVIREARWGIIDGDDRLVGNDEAISLRTYANNEGEWILGRTASEELQDAQGKRISLRRSYYDGAAFVGLPLGAVDRGDLRRVESWIEGDHSSDEFRAEHDKDGNIVTSHDGRGGRSEYEYDATKQFLSSERRFASPERALEWKATFDGRLGAVTSITDPNGHTTRATYDSLGRIEKLVRPGDTLELPTHQYEYKFDVPTSVVTARARQRSGSSDELLTIAHVDGFGRTRAGFSEGSEGGAWVMRDFSVVDARGNPSFKAYPVFSANAEMPALASNVSGVTTKRDATGRELTTLLPDGSRTRVDYAPLASTSYDENDLDPLSPARDTPTTTTLDGFGRLVSVVERDGQREITSGAYKYDPAGKLVELVDALGHVRHYLHDGRGRRVLIDDPNAGLWRFEFTDGNDLARRIDPTGTLLSYEYDALGRVVEEYQSLDGAMEYRVTLHHYDESAPNHPELGNTVGQLAWVEDAAGIEYFGYDNQGRQTDSIRRTEDGTEYPTWTDFDSQDRVIRRGFPDRTHLDLEYDSRGLLASIAGVASGFKWTPHGALQSVTLGNGVTETRSYDGRQRLSQMAATNHSGAVLRGLSFSFDRASRITSVADLRSTTTPDEDLSAAYEYDGRNRLTSAIYRTGATAWQLDDVGKILSVTSDFSDP